MGDHTVVKSFRRAELAKLTGCNLETIRYYEKVGLLPSPPRTGGGHRLYSETLRKRLIFIRRSRELGFTLDEIRNLLRLAEQGDTCGDVKEAALMHIQGVRSKIADLERMERTLADTAARCEGGTAPDCPIIEILSGERGD